MKKICSLLICLLISATSIQAEIKLPALIGDYMVLQQASKVRIWGECPPNTSVNLQGSWDNNKYTTQANKQGEWEIWLQTPSASFDKHQVHIQNGTDKVVLHDVLIGEVWFCSGQSNMEMPLKGFYYCPIQDANRTIATAGQYRSSLRYSTIQKSGKAEPQTHTVGGEWKECNPLNAPDFGATAYYFGTLLTEVLNVPVGIINCSWGGSTVEGWLPKEILQQYADVDLATVGSKELHEMLQPMIMYNGMLKPASKYTIKGFLWYQGESNVGRPDYAKRLATMVAHWREIWGIGELPFYEVEIAPYAYGNNDQAAFLREQQYKATQLIPNSGMISTNDLVRDYERRQIHPIDKKTIGDRLCYMALANTYGYSSIADKGPEYDRMEMEGDKIVVYFTNAAEGFDRKEGITGFEIAGKDLSFRPAKAIIDQKRNAVVVSAPGVKKPVAVRYCFRDFLVGNLYNLRGLPTVPFRTDQ